VILREPVARLVAQVLSAGATRVEIFRRDSDWEAEAKAELLLWPEVSRVRPFVAIAVGGRHAPELPSRMTRESTIAIDFIKSSWFSTTHPLYHHPLLPCLPRKKPGRPLVPYIHQRGCFSVDPNLCRDRPLLCLQHNHVVVVRDILQCCID